jgi:hypothetical protein
MVSNLAAPIRRCYITDQRIESESSRTGRPPSEIVAAALPDPGSTMAGDFGEILTFLYQSTRLYPAEAVSPKKWRLKEDRNRPAPKSDVIHLLLPSWPQASDRDALICSEAKLKSTAGASNPIDDAISDSQKDRASRLAKTLVWLRDRATLEDIGGVTLDQLNRFIDLTAHPAPEKQFYAVAVICGALLDEELRHAPADAPPYCSLVVITAPNLKEIYASAYEATRDTLRRDPRSSRS